MKLGTKTFLTALALLGLAGLAGAATVLPRIDIGVRAASSPQDVSLSLQILFLLTVLSLAPAILMLCTSFTRIIIFIPFLIIDMVVASTLMSMGMMMLPPVTISLPFKILLFVMIDGWHLIVRSLMTSFH